MSNLPLPDVGENFSAYTLLLSLTVSQQTLRRGNDGHAQAAQNLRQFGGLCVHTQTRLRHATQTREGTLTIVVLKLEGQLAALDGVVSDVAFLLQDLGDVRLELGGRHRHGIVVRIGCVAHARQHVGNRISHSHMRDL